MWVNLGKVTCVRVGKPRVNPSIGPLLWHWENNTTNDPSIELTLDEVKTLAKSIGFTISVSYLRNNSCFHLSTQNRTNEPLIQPIQITLSLCLAIFTTPHFGLRPRNHESTLGPNRQTIYCMYHLAKFLIANVIYSVRF